MFLRWANSPLDDAYQTKQKTKHLELPSSCKNLAKNFKLIFINIFDYIIKFKTT